MKKKPRAKEKKNNTKPDIQPEYKLGLSN